MMERVVKYPIGVQSFSEVRERGCIYFDKTEQIYNLAIKGKVYFLSRPRRFGKSLLVSTLEAYFSGKKELFKGLEIEKLEKDWVQYPVLRFDFSGTKYQSEGDLDGQLRLQLEYMEKEYGSSESEHTPAERFQGLIRRAYEKTGRKVVFLVDEYDAPLLDSSGKTELQDKLRNMLRSFYSVVKMSDPFLRFVFLTGVSKFSQMSIFSEFNSLQNISMNDRYSTLCGITDQEIKDNLRSEVEALGENNSETYEEALQHLEKMYDGYRFSPKGERVYNPFSLLNALNDRRYNKYWFSTGTPTFLIGVLQKTGFHIEKLESMEAPAEQFDAPMEFASSPLPVLYQSGYLTIKDYDPVFRTYTLAYPNEEVKMGFLNALIPFYVEDPNLERNSFVKGVVQDLWKNELESCMSRVTAFFSSIPYELNNKNEKHYHTIFYLLFSILGAYVESEVRSAVGRADAVIKTSTHIYVFEFKIDGSVEEALKQIDDKGYLVPYIVDHRKLVKIGVNFDTSTRTVSEWRAVEA